MNANDISLWRIAMLNKSYFIVAIVIILLLIAAALETLAGNTAKAQRNAFSTALSQEQVISIQEGINPGSEGRPQDDDVSDQPTITAYLSDESKSNGTAVIVCPGGAFRALSISDEGSQVDRWLNDHGMPDFVAILYGQALVDVNVPTDAPPLFIAVAADHMPVSAGCVALYNLWKAVGKSAELHVYSNGRAGFGM
jgi:hypothetical protein